MKKTLAIFIFSLGKGGAEKIVSILLKYLVNKYEVKLVLLNDEIVYDIPKSVSIHYLDKGQQKNFFSKIFSIVYLAKSYTKFCREHQVDYSLSLLTRPNFISLLSKILGNKSKIYISEHIALSSWRKSEQLYKKISKFFIKTFYPLADRIVVVSKIIKEDLITEYKIPADKIEVIYNPHDFTLIENKKNEELKLNEDNKKIITSMGTLNERKGFRYLIDAFARLDRDDIELWILGDGPDREKLETQIKNLGKNGKNIKLLGFQSNPYKYLNKSDIFVLASDNEGLPNVIIEALSCSNVVISTDCISGPREILAPNSDISFQINDKIEKGKYGLLVPIRNITFLKDALDMILNNDDLFYEYQLISQQRAYEFKFEIQCEQYVQFIEGKSL